MLRPLLTQCPLCAGQLTVERVRCAACDSAVEGQFDLDWLGKLSAEQLRFVKVFLSCRGKIKDVEQALGLSYPTVVSRLDEVVAAMGSPMQPPSTERLGVLDQLSKGSISVDEAERLLRKR